MDCFKITMQQITVMQGEAAEQPSSSMRQSRDCLEATTEQTEVVQGEQAVQLMQLKKSVE